jgi:hypothetical protein
MDEGQAKFEAAYATIGELVVVTTALDRQLTQILITVFDLKESTLLEPVVATLDAVRKIEMLKRWGEHIRQSDWRKSLLNYLDSAEKVSGWRNTACHTLLVPAPDGPVFAPATAARLLKAIPKDGKPENEDRVSAEDLKGAIASAMQTLAEGDKLIENFKKMQTLRKERFGGQAR